MTQPEALPNPEPLNDKHEIPNVTKDEILKLIDDDEIEPNFRASITAFMSEGWLSIDQVRDMVMSAMKPDIFLNKLQALRSIQKETTEKSTKIAAKIAGKAIEIATSPVRFFKN